MVSKGIILLILPLRWVCLPVSMVAREGEQIELVTLALVKSMPSFASRSIFGVCISLSE